MPAGEEATQQVRRVAHEGERRPRIDWILAEEPCGASDQRGGRTERTHPASFSVGEVIVTRSR